MPRPVRDALAAVLAEVRADCHAAAQELFARSQAANSQPNNHHSGSASTAMLQASPGGRSKREAGLWKVLEAAVADAEVRVAQAAARRADIADAAIKRCATLQQTVVACAGYRHF